MLDIVARTPDEKPLAGKLMQLASAERRHRVPLILNRLAEFPLNGVGIKL